ncbi:hypothetical protein [Paraburkholderia sp. BCC1876]|uniref:hypothetical protein n=1 Tax=Paraburkholderia sp. BCC1876 TaxID=2676303 RepID=UPI0015909DEE|nr:hypothetical protein [Paraburkholderia sp. BCC1876]
MPAETPLLKGKSFDYDRDLYDRQFMSCLFRHAVVWFGKMGLPADLLFYDALASSDAVMQQMVVDKLPKFAFRCDSFSDADFDLIGVKEIGVLADTFVEVRPLIVKQIESGKAVLLEGNVFYFPHCPEYRNAHAQHVVVIDHIMPDGSWHIVDDDPASVLCEYVYEDAVVARFFENSVNRKLRYYELDPSRPLGEVVSLIDDRFEAFVRGHRDTFTFYDAVRDILRNPYDSNVNKHRLLHDCFSILAGSRKCFARYLQISHWPDSLVIGAMRCSKEASVLKSVMARAMMTGALRFDGLVDRCLLLKQLESDLYGSLVAGLRK